MKAFPSLKEFIDNSPTAFHAAGVISTVLKNTGYRQLNEADKWNLESGTGYFIVREKRAVAAFITGTEPPAEAGLNVVAAHLDSPALKLKIEAASEDKGAWRFPVESYGSPILQSWLDRELEVAGMVTFRNSMDNGGQNILSKSWRSSEPVAIIPSLAIHLNKDVNKGVELNIQNHMAALIPGIDIIPDNKKSDVQNPILERIFRDLNISSKDYLSSELYLVPAQKASFIGDTPGQLIISGRLDNLAMSHAILRSLPDFSSVGDSGIMALWFDAEEIGSKTSTGASSLFPDEIIERMVLSSGGGREELIRCRRQSFLISADMAHGVHPNYSDRHDKSYSPEMGSGPVLKSHGQKHYATEVFSEARILEAAGRVGITMQKMINRSDLPCGSTVGPLSSAGLSMSTVDVGNPLWGMHSSRETASMSDHLDMIKLLRECFIS